jgi:pimeloyl-ACP methyl ester carboxylesterase
MNRLTTIMLALTAALHAAPTKADVFDIGGNKVLVHASPRPANGNPWIWYAPTIKGDVLIVRHDLSNWPLQRSKPETLADFAMTEEDLIARLGEFNPISNLAGLAGRKVPMLSVHGDNDAVVPCNDNPRLLKEHYEAAGGTCSVKIIHGGGHEVTPAFFECQELIDFVLQHSRP